MSRSAKADRVDAALRRGTLIKACVLVQDATVQLIESTDAPKRIRDQAAKVYRWVGEVLHHIGIQSEHDVKLSLSSGMLREYSDLAERINGHLLRLPAQKRTGAMHIAIVSLVSDVRSTMREYRNVPCVRYMDQTFETLTMMVLDGDEEAEIAGSNIYEAVVM